MTTYASHSDDMLMIRLTGRIWQEGASYVSFCDQLDAATSGKTLDEVRRRTVELIEIHLEEAMSAGTLDELLARLGACETRCFDEGPTLAAPSRAQPGFDVNLAFLLSDNMHIPVHG